MRTIGRRQGLAGRALSLAIVTLCLGVTVHGHEIGATRVSVTFQENRTYTVEILTDATALLEKLDTSIRGPLPASSDSAHVETLLTRFDEKFRQRVRINFDGAEIRPASAYSVTPAIDAQSVPAATIRLTGDIPRGAREFTWSYSWTFTSYALMVRRSTSDTPTIEWLEGGQRSAPFPLTSHAPPADRLDAARRYFTLGFTHIVPHGLDHVLFVLGIYLLSRRARSVLWQVSAFTVAHSITLGLSMYGVVAVSPRIVEPLIALSIAYVAIENVFLTELKAWRVGLVFAFGLLHGMGFAGALQELGMPQSEFVTALLTFNAGVEVGQLVVIGAAFLLVGWYCAHRWWYRNRVVIPASAMIACTALYWTIERVFS